MFRPPGDEPFFMIMHRSIDYATTNGHKPLPDRDFSFHIPFPERLSP